MGFMGFVMWFSIGIIGTMFLLILFNNYFVVSFLVGIIMGVLGAKEM